MYGDGHYQTQCGDPFTMYTNGESECCTSETNIISITLQLKKTLKKTTTKKTLI